MTARYLNTEQAAAFLGRSRRFVLDRTTRGAIPHRKLANTRDNLYLVEELSAWVDGAELETVWTLAGGRIVRPKRGS